MARPTRRDVLAVLYAAYRRYGRTRFAVNPLGPNYPALKEGENLGWVWFAGPRSAAITQDGLRELEPYGVKP